MLWLPRITQNKKYPLNQVATITYTLEKKSFSATTFNGLWVAYFETK